jgi:hypothetical protein
MVAEYFTKWVEAKHVTNITSATIQKFFWQNIIYHYGVPQQITVDNAKYFYSGIFNNFYHQVGMKVIFATVYHPQSNRAVERANTLIFEAIKKIVEGKKRQMDGSHAEDSVESHHNSLWSHQFHSISAIVRSQGNITQKSQTPKYVHNSEGIVVPQ